MQWIIDKLPPNDRPSLILCSDGSIHVGYPCRLEFYGGEFRWVWEVGGWECCCTCGGISRISFEEVGHYDKEGKAWMPLPCNPEKPLCPSQGHVLTWLPGNKSACIRCGEVFQHEAKK